MLEIHHSELADCKYNHLQCVLTLHVTDDDFKEYAGHIERLQIHGKNRICTFLLISRNPICVSYVLEKSERIKLKKETGFREDIYLNVIRKP